MGERANFMLTSYEHPLPKARYAAALAIESIEHSGNLGVALTNLGRCAHEEDRGRAS